MFRWWTGFICVTQSLIGCSDGGKAYARWSIGTLDKQQQLLECSSSLEHHLPYSRRTWSWTYQGQRVVSTFSMTNAFYSFLVGRKPSEQFTNYRPRECEYTQAGGELYPHLLLLAFYITCEQEPTHLQVSMWSLLSANCMYKICTQQLPPPSH